MRNTRAAGTWRTYCPFLPGAGRNGWPALRLRTGAGKEFRPLPHRMDHGRLPPLDGQTLATYKDSTRS